MCAQFPFVGTESKHVDSCCGQPLGRLSPAAAEAKAITQGCVEGTSANNLLEGHTGETYSLQLWSDNPSARTISQRLEQCGDSTCQNEACLKVHTTFEEMTTRQPC